MPFYIRKAFNLGPLRLNASKSGIGVSIGIKGLRAGQRPDGQAYIHAGRGGVYLRENVGSKPATGPVEEPVRVEQPPDSLTKYDEYQTQLLRAHLDDQELESRLRATGTPTQLAAYERAHIARDGPDWRYERDSTVRRLRRELAVPRSQQPQIREGNLVFPPSFREADKFRWRLNELLADACEEAEYEKAHTPAEIVEFRKICADVEGSPFWREERAQTIQRLRLHIEQLERGEGQERSGGTSALGWILGIAALMSVASYMCGGR